MTAEELDDQLQPILDAELRTSRTIAMALVIGVAMFSAVSGFLGFTNQGASTGEPQTLILFSGITGAMFVALWVASFVVPRLSTSGQLQQAVQQGAKPAMGVLRSRMIISLALREGAALMGLVAVLIAATGGMFRAAPWVLADALPALAFIAHTLATLPTRESVRGELLALVALS